MALVILFTEGPPGIVGEVVREEGVFDLKLILHSFPAAIFSGFTVFSSLDMVLLKGFEVGFDAVGQRWRLKALG